MRVALAHVFSLIFLSLAEGNEESDQIHYTNSWAVHVDHDVLESVNELANKHGFTNLGQVRTNEPVNKSVAFRSTISNSFKRLSIQL